MSTMELTSWLQVLCRVPQSKGPEASLGWGGCSRSMEASVLHLVTRVFIRVPTYGLAVVLESLEQSLRIKAFIS